MPRGEFIANYLVKHENLADVPDKEQARQNLGIVDGASPVGSILMWATECTPSGWFICDGQALSRFCYPELFNVLGIRYGQGGNNAILTEHNGNIITCTNAAHGEVLDAEDGTTEFDITVTQSGNVNQPQVTDVICNAASTLSNGAYFTIDSAGLAFAVIYRIDQQSPGTVIPDRLSILIDVNSDDNASTVAAKSSQTIADALFNLPDCRGRFVRGQDRGALRDLDARNRDDRGDGETGDVVGTTQADEFRAHQHDYYYEYNPTRRLSGRRNPEDNVIWPPNQRYNSTTGLAGGLETRPKNINLLYIIKAVD